MFGLHELWVKGVFFYFSYANIEHCINAVTDLTKNESFRTKLDSLNV
jgi:hypothetical protein